LLRLVHPFPSALDGLVVSAVSLVAGGAAVTAVRLGLAMFALQASIGALNDVVDAPHDAGRKPGKPIPAGLLSRSEAQVVVAVAGLIGLALSAASGVVTLVLAVVVLAIGYGYDLLAKGTAWSWVPFAVGIPLLPVFGWYGTTGELVPVFALLVPVAVVTGAALAIANARADADRDAAAAIDSVAIRLGPRRSWLVASGLLVAVALIAIATLVAWRAPFASILGAMVGIAVVGIGIGAGRDRRPARLERAWELQAVGVGVLAAAWLAGWAAT
jgi:4-hydroxybenzoate polyprenyltransferase